MRSSKRTMLGDALLSRNAIQATMGVASIAAPFVASGMKTEDALEKARQLLADTTQYLMDEGVLK